MEPNEKHIKIIAEELESGMKCFFALKTGEIRTVPDFDDWLELDDEVFKQELRAIDEKRDDYFEFSRPGSRESYQIMVDFAEEIEHTRLQNKLLNALDKRKPFQHFKREIDNSGEYRQKWFDYRKMRYIQWVKEQINTNKTAFE